MRTTDAQVRKLMEEMKNTNKIGVAAARAGMHRETARKYVAAAKLPSELLEPRSWRTRENPFEEVWAEIVTHLEDAPELEGKALFGHLMEQRPGQFDPGQLRTFQRHVREWRAQHGPPKEVFFAQEHRPGEAMQTDFTWGDELEVTIGGEAFSHLLCHPVLPYSNWEWVTLCQSESMAALRRGVQAAVFELGRVPEWHQTDNSSAATHALATGKRAFNPEYESLMDHLKMKPRTIEVGKSHQNGDVESANGAFKRRVKQHLLLRGSRDFTSREEYECWLQGVCEKANGLRAKRLADDLGAMKALDVKRLPEWVEVKVKVSFWSTIRVKRNSYSVPSRLIGEEVKVRVFEDRLVVYHALKYQLTIERLLGEQGHRINYRHIIDSLVRKPGAFRRYKYREDLFPNLTFRKAYDRLCERCSERNADLNYLRILYLASRTMEADVEAALDILMEAGELPLVDRVRSLAVDSRPEVPDMPAAEVDLSRYDDLLPAMRKERA